MKHIRVLYVALVLWVLLAAPREAAAISIKDFTNAPAITSTSFFYIVEFRGGTNYTNFYASGHQLSNWINAVSGSYVTNECYVSYGLNTNVTLSVSNAGLAAVNGLYRTNNLDGLTNGIYKVCYDSAFGSFVISNATQKIYGYDDVGDTDIGTGAHAWSTDFLGNPPLPTSWWGPVTNCFTVLASSVGLAQPLLSSNLYVNADIGNDTNAVRGRQDRPWRNLQPALLASRPGDTVLLGPGWFPTLPKYGVNLYLSNGVSLVGSGRGVTIVGTPGAPEDFLQCGGTFVIRDLSLYGVPVVGGIAPTCTNSLIDSCEIGGAADAIYVADFETLLLIKNTDLFSMYDGIADWDGSPNGSNRVIRLLNCHIICTNGAGGEAFPRRCLEGGDSRFEMFGGSLEARNGSDQTSCIRLDMAVSGRTNKSGSVLLSNVRLRHSHTNGLSQMVSNFNNLPVFFDNCTEEIVPGALVSGSFTNQWWHRNIAFPNGSTRTNWLVDTRSLTNALVAASEQGHQVRITDDLRTAAGTNILIYPLAGQTISGGALDAAGRSYTNITANGGSILLQIRGNNWQVVQRQ